MCSAGSFDRLFHAWLSPWSLPTQHVRDFSKTIIGYSSPKTRIPEQDAFASLHKSVASATAELQDFRALYTSDETKKILEQAAKSREAQPENIKTWRARDHPDWLESKKMSSAL